MLVSPLHKGVITNLPVSTLAQKQEYMISPEVFQQERFQEYLCYKMKLQKQQKKKGKKIK